VTSSRTNDYGIGLIGGRQCNVPSTMLQFERTWDERTWDCPNSQLLPG